MFPSCSPVSQLSESAPDPLLDGLNPPQREAVLASEGPVLMLAFPRKGQPISLDDREVMFHAKMGPIEIKAKFPLKEMVYGGQLAL